MDKKYRTTAPEYSYRQSIKKENVKIYRRIALIITGFFVVTLIIWFMGTNFLNALSILSNGNKTDSSPQQSDNSLPLLTPTIDKLPSATNQDLLEISGTTTSNVSVTLYVNSLNVKTLQSDSSGKFDFLNAKLTDGLNLIKVTATDKSGANQSATTTITLDKIKPSLALTNPIDGTNYPATTTSIDVAGSTEPDAIVYVNGSQAIVDSNGNFVYKTPVLAGANTIIINATDSAGNVSSVTVNVNVSSTSAPPDGTQP